MQQGIVYNIQRYSIHDGPGIRTTVFLKGCPLNCWWCHNPESQSFKPEIMYNKDSCIVCGSCIQSCQEGAIKIAAGIVVRSISRCKLCGNCVRSCLVGAQELVGREMTVDEIIKEVEKDIIFYDQSGGGVTLSGGEPLMQFRLLQRLIKKFHQRGINIAVDTCGYIAWDKLEKIASEIDIFLYDLKLMDSEKHRKYTGVGNEKILENLTKLAQKDSNYKIYGRVPLIPGINDDRENIEGIGRLLVKLGINDLNILPYHGIAYDKYKRLGIEYKMQDIEILSEERIKYLVGLLKDLGLHVKIGG